MTEFLFRDDAYLAEAAATVTAAGPEGIELDRTLFYASSGGQPGDTGRIILGGGGEVGVTGAVHPDGDRGRVLHLAAPEAVLPLPGERVGLRLDWDRRYRLMRMHTALHLLSVALPYGVTGGSIGEDKGRLDFDMPEPPDDVAAIEARLNALCRRRAAGGRGMDHRGRARGAAGDGQDHEGQAAQPARAGCG